MKRELDEYLCKTYPKMFVNRHKSMQETCMCWGFECGDGWFQILNQLCLNIQHHIDWSIKNHERDIVYNKMVAEMQNGDFDYFDNVYASPIWSEDFKNQRKDEILKKGLCDFKGPCPQVTVDQVKEKFGTLRFYYTGGDDKVRGMVSMAESMSGVTCEECGNPGTTSIGGYIRTLCKEHGGTDFDTDEDDLLKQGFEQ